MKMKILNITCLAILITLLKVNSAFNLESDKLILKKQNSNGPLMLQLKKFKVDKTKRVDRSKISDIIFKDNGLSDENGGYSGNFNSFYQPAVFYMGNKRQKREIFDNTNHNDLLEPTESTKIARSLFTDLVEIPTSKNITFIKPSEVELYNVSPYNTIVMLSKNDSDSIKPTQLAPTEPYSNINTLLHAQVKNGNYKIPNDFYMPAGDFQSTVDPDRHNHVIPIRKYDKEDANVTSNPEKSNKVLKEVPLKIDLDKSITLMTSMNTRNESKESDEIVNNVSLFVKPKLQKHMDKDYNRWESHALVTKEEIENNNNKLKEYLVKMQNKNIRKIDKIKSHTTEFGLLKVLSLLTKTFKKIVKQHEDIKRMHKDLIIASKEFMSKRRDILRRIMDINQSNQFLFKLGKNLTESQNNLLKKQQTILEKETELMHKRQEFQRLQTKFAVQQHQFYQLQKLVTNKNEKILEKQNEISKKQQEIAERQNMYAAFMDKKEKIRLNKFLPKTDRVMKKNPLKAHKPFYGEIKTLINSLKNNFRNKFITKDNDTKTQNKGVNIIPKRAILVNHDKDLLKEKDIHDINVLIYKYYFNNTDLGGLVGDNKLNEENMSTPKINDTSSNQITITSIESSTNIIQATSNQKENNQVGEIDHQRRKRWIDRKNKKLKGGKLKPYRRFERTKTTKKANENTTLKPTTKKVTEAQSSEDTEEIEPLMLDSQNRFNKATFITTTRKAEEKAEVQVAQDQLLTMAKRYCNEIDQNSSELSFNWCVEKALRQAQPRITIATPPSMPIKNTIAIEDLTKSKVVKKQDVDNVAEILRKAEILNETEIVKKVQLLKDAELLPVYEKIPMRMALTTTLPTTTSVITTKATMSPYFPDNDELEAKIQEYELPKKPVDGTVFWDASIHASQFQFMDDQQDNGGASDHMPGDDDGSGQIDPVALELQAKKRAFVRQLNKVILKKNSKLRKTI